MTHELTIEYNEACNFYKVTCENGCYITDYTSDKNIEEYIASTEMYIPGKYTIEEIKNKYHCITEKEKDTFDKLYEENIEKEMNKNKPQ